MGWATKGAALGIAFGDDSACLSLRKGLRSKDREHWDVARPTGSDAEKDLLEMLRQSDQHGPGALPYPAGGDMTKGLRETSSLESDRPRRRGTLYPTNCLEIQYLSQTI